MQELFYGPYFCAEQQTQWYELTERVPDGPTTQLMSELARKHEHRAGRAGLRGGPHRRLLQHGGGDRRRRPLPRQVPQDAHPALRRPASGRSSTSGPATSAIPVFETRVGKVGVYICYDRHFPEGARCLGLNGAEIVFNPSATVAGLSEYLWKLEQPAHAVANGYFVGAINRPGFEEPWRIGEFYGQSYFCDPRGQMLAVGRRDGDDIVIADLDLDLIREVRNTWQFFRDRRPETLWRDRAALTTSIKETPRWTRMTIPAAPRRARGRCPPPRTRPAPYDGPSRDEVLAMRRQYLTPGLITYYREPLLIVEGHMQYLWDETGKQYLDAFAGIVTVSVGHCHPKIVEKVREQVGRLQHTTTIYLHPDDRASSARSWPSTCPRGAACRSATSPIPAARPTRSRSCRRASSPATPRSSACATATTAGRRRRWR